MSLNKEILSIRKQMDKYALEQSKPLLLAYKRSLNDIRSYIGKITLEYAVEGVITVTKAQKYTVMKNLEKALLKQAKELGHIDVSHTTNILEEVYRQSYHMTAFQIDRGVSVGVNFALLRPEMVKAAVNMPIAGEMFSDRIWKNKEQLVNRIRRDVEKAIVQGQDIEKLSRQLTKDFGSSAYESERLLRTETARCMGMAQDDIYRESGIVKEVLFDATLDDKTSDICQGHDGKTYSLEDHPKIPEDTHPNCRSCIIPIVPGWEPSKKLDNMTKQSIDYADYGSWAKSKGIG